jgi:hypothetical protein
MDYREIGYVLGVSENAGRTRVHRGLARLRKSLGGHAGALVAALGLPRVAEASLIGKSTAAGSAVAGGGMLLMGTATKLAGAAAVGAALTAVTMMTFEGSGRASRSRSNVAERELAENEVGREVSGAFAGFEATPQERAWMRAQLEKERHRRADAEIQPQDTGLDILERREKWNADVTDLVRSPEQFRARVRRAEGAAYRVDSTEEINRPARDDATLAAEIVEFGPGTFVLDSSRGWKFGRLDEDLARLEIRGAGRDRTTLIDRRGSLLRAKHRIEHLRIRDVTVQFEGSGSTLLSADGRVAVVLESVRVQARATSRYLLTVQGGAYLGARDCEFLGGYDALGYGAAGIVLSGTGILSFEGCRFADLNVTLSARGIAAAKSAVHFESCTWENAPLTREEILHEGRPVCPLSVRGGTVHADDRDSWGGQFAASLEDVEFVDAIPRCRLADLMRVVREIESSLSTGQRLVAIDALRTAQDAPRKFVICVAQPNPKGGEASLEQRCVKMAGGRVVPVRNASRFKLPPKSQLSSEAGATIGEVIARAHLDPTQEAYGIWVVRRGAVAAGEPATVVQLRSHPTLRRALLALDAATGEAIPR